MAAETCRLTGRGWMHDSPVAAHAATHKQQIRFGDDPPCRFDD
ncbi:hypothetical protein C7S15_7113 [Burkholderia cepacia]|nr:hypothetical protein [Burkholderia cepacia]